MGDLMRNNLHRTNPMFLAIPLMIAFGPNICLSEWSRFRGPNGSGRAEADMQLPTTWSNDQGVRWKTAIPRGSSSPVLSEDKIFITGYSGYATSLGDAGDRTQLKLHVLAYDLATGRELWDYSFNAADAEQEATKRIADHGYASSTPCTDGEAVYASFGPSGVVAVDMSGKLLWQRAVGTGVAGFGAASSPIEYKNVVIVNASIESKTLFGLDKATGEIVWEVDSIDRAWTTPAIVELETGPAELVIHYKDRIQGLNPLTGDSLWSCRGIPDYIVPVPIVVGDRVYFSGGRQNRTIAVAAGGRGDVTQTHRLWEVTNGANVTTPIFHQGNLYWAHDKGFAQSLNAENGELNYQERFRSRDRVYASVVYGDGKFYMTLRDGTTVVLAAGPEYSELASNQLGISTEDEVEQFNATPAIVDDTLIFRSTKSLYRIGKE